jgi:hypothetical protein
MSAIAPLLDAVDERTSDVTRSRVVRDLGPRDDRSTSAPLRPASGRAHVWYAFGRWLETIDVGEDDAFVLA